MNRTSLIRLGGLAAMVGGVVFVVLTLSSLVVDVGDERYLAPIYALLTLVAMVAVACIAALYVREGERKLWLALVTSLVSLIGLGILLAYAMAVLPGLNFSVHEYLVLLGVLLVTSGLVALGFLTIAGRVLPRWCGAALVVGSPIFAFLGPLWGGVVLGGAWTLVGYAIFRAAARPPERSSRVRSGRKPGEQRA